MVSSSRGLDAKFAMQDFSKILLLPCRGGDGQEGEDGPLEGSTSKMRIVKCTFFKIVNWQASYEGNN